MQHTQHILHGHTLQQQQQQQQQRRLSATQQM
jgi:hypothetical protein